MWIRSCVAPITLWQIVVGLGGSKTEEPSIYSPNSRLLESTYQRMRALLQTEAIAQESAAHANPDRPEDLPRRHFRLIYKGNAAMRQYFEELKTERGLRLMSRDMTDVRDPRVYPTGAEWRDTIRTKLNFEELRVDFLLLELESADESEELALYSFMQDHTASWSDVKDFVSRYESLIFIYRLRPLSEDDEFHLEFDGVPVQVSTFMVADESNGIRLHPEISVLNSQST